MEQLPAEGDLQRSPLSAFNPSPDSQVNLFMTSLFPSIPSMTLLRITSSNITPEFCVYCNMFETSVSSEFLTLIVFVQTL